MRGAALLRWAASLTIAAGCATVFSDAPDYSAVPAWTSRAIPEARGDLRTVVNGKREALRYTGWSKQDFQRFRTYAYADTRSEIPVQLTIMPRLDRSVNYPVCLHRFSDKVL